MNKYQKSAADRFSKIREKEYLISPMSETDCEIIVEIGQILKKQGLNDVFEVLKSYKEVKDIEVLETLQQWNIDHPNGKADSKISKLVDKIVQEEEERISKPPFVKIGTLSIRMNHLLGIDLYERIDKEGNEKYGILLNPTPDNTKQVPLYSNHQVEFFTEEERTTVLNNLECVCQEQGIDFIDLMNNEE